jgi:hypothetical protein
MKYAICKKLGPLKYHHKMLNFIKISLICIIEKFEVISIQCPLVFKQPSEFQGIEICHSFSTTVYISTDFGIHSLCVTSQVNYSSEWLDVNYASFCKK